MTPSSSSEFDNDLRLVPRGKGRITDSEARVRSLLQLLIMKPAMQTPLIIAIRAAAANFIRYFANFRSDYEFVNTKL